MPKFVYVNEAIINIDAISCVKQTHGKNPSSTIHLFGGQTVETTLTPMGAAQFFLNPKNHLSIQGD